MIELARAGATLHGAHPLVSSPVTSIGQGVDEPAQTLRSGDVYALHAGVSEGNQHAVVSAVVALGPAGNEILWKN
jgi:hypothetical protein